MWLIICDVENLKKKYSDFKYNICRKKEKGPWDDVIEKDLHRTYPEETYFQNNYKNHVYF